MKLGRGELVLNYLILCIFTAITVVPLVGVLVSALTPVAESGVAFKFPSRLDFENFATVWKTSNFSTYLISSVLVTTGDVIFTLTLAIPAAFAFAHLRFPGAKIIFFILLSGLMIPEAAFIIPLYYNLRTLGLTDNYWGLILPQTALSLGFTIFWLRNFFVSVPSGIIDAARLDGARDLKILWHILLPLARPALATASLLVGMWTWNAFLLPLVIISKQSMRTAPLALAFFQGQYTTDYSLLAAAGTLIALPVVVLYLFLQRHFIRGMLSGSIKG